MSLTHETENIKFIVSFKQNSMQTYDLTIFVEYYVGFKLVYAEMLVGINNPFLHDIISSYSIPNMSIEKITML